MTDEIVQQKVFVTQGDKVIQKHVLDLTPDESGRISGAIDTFLSVKKQLNPNFADDALQPIIERVDASGRPADDVMSYTFADNEMRREARKQFEDEINAREQASQSVAPEAQRQADREEYLRPSNRAEVARQLQPNQPQVTAPAQPARQWTDEEIAAMTSEDMVRLGLVNRPGRRIEDRQGASGEVIRFEFQPDKVNEIRRRKDLMRPIAEVMADRKAPKRPIKFSEEELASAQYRKQVLAQNDAERRKVKADIARVLEEQEEAKRNAKKR